MGASKGECETKTKQFLTSRVEIVIGVGIWESAWPALGFARQDILTDEPAT